jgi:hypothetical protein
MRLKPGDLAEFMYGSILDFYGLLDKDPVTGRLGSFGCTESEMLEKTVLLKYRTSAGVKRLLVGMEPIIAPGGVSRMTIMARIVKKLNGCALNGDKPEIYDPSATD